MIELEQPVDRRKLTEPLGGTVRFFGLLMAVFTVLVVFLTVFGIGSASIGGFGHTAVCVDQPGTTYGSLPPSDPALAARAGVDVSMNGTVHACAQHPDAGKRFLYTLMTIPSGLVWVGVLFLLWRLVRAAEKSGPFQPRVAGLLRLTGWFIIAGSILTAAIQGAATDALLNTMLNSHDSFGDAIPRPGGLVGPALAGVVALTFARIVRRGARMDEDLQGTI